MKKLISFFAVFLMLFGFAASFAYAEGSVSLTGPSTVRAGDTITLTLKVNASSSHGVDGKFAYDSDQVSIKSISTQLSGWESDRQGDYFYSMDENLEKPIKSNSKLLTAKFYVKESVKAGSKVTISVENVSINGESGEFKDSYSVTVAQPLSGDATLKKLSVEEGELSPDFSSSVTEYDIGEVPFSVSKLDITATPNDDGAEVDISGNSLDVGRNTVRITVTAETGAEKEYTIKVTRAQDPDYVPSSNAALSDITVSAGALSPAFDKDTLKYVVYVPYETETITLGGKAEDEKAQDVTGAEEAALGEGENVLTVTGKAEDGTELAYTVTVVRMPEYTGIVSEKSEAPSEEPQTSEPESSPETASSVTHEDGGDDSRVGGVGVGLFILCIILAVGCGFVICLIFVKTGVMPNGGSKPTGIKSPEQSLERKKRNKYFTFDDR